MAHSVSRRSAGGDLPFGATQGTGQVWLGTTNGVVQSWSDTQITAQVAAGSLSGKSQVLQAGVWSNAATFNVSTLQIKSISPTSGTSGTAVTITGSGFGSSQGAGIVLLGSTTGQVVSWTDSQIVSTVSPTSVSGVVRVLQNSTWSNALTFTVTSGGSTMSIVPNILTMTVGETHTIAALNSTQQRIPGLSWTSSDPAIVSLSAEDPPVLTAVAAGHVTITAGAASADVTVVGDDLLPIGSVLWSVPLNADRIVPAVPSESGVADVFAYMNGGTVAAIKDDGSIAWTVDASRSLDNYYQDGRIYYPWVLPDFQGGLVIQAANRDGTQPSIRKIDGITGASYPAYIPSSTPPMALGDIVVHPDGTIFTVTSTRVASPDVRDVAIVGINPLTGTEKFRIPLIASPGPCNIAGEHAMIVAGDGNAYIAIDYVDDEFADGGCRHTGYWGWKVARVSSEGLYQIFDVEHWPIDTKRTDNRATLLTNGDSGAVMLYRTCAVPCDYFQQRMALISNGGATAFRGPEIADQQTQQMWMDQVVQAQDGSFIGRTYAGGDPYDDTTWIPYMVAFNQNGSVRWSVANEEPQIATEDGGVIGKSGITYDQFGGATGQIDLLTQSWRGNMYRRGSIERLAANCIYMALTLWAQPGGFALNWTASRPWHFRLVFKNRFVIDPSNPESIHNDQARAALTVDATSQAAVIKKAAVDAFKKAFANWPVTVAEGLPNTGTNRVNVVDGDSPSAVEGCGSTDTRSSSVRDSSVYYMANMEIAQFALPIQMRTLQDVQNALQRRDYMKAIGAGIGNNAAHEMAHQLAAQWGIILPGLDNTSVNTYNGAKCNGDTRWVFGIGDIHWSESTAHTLGEKLKAWH